MRVKWSVSWILLVGELLLIGEGLCDVLKECCHKFKGKDHVDFLFLRNT